MIFIKQFGLQRSGTNYLKALIDENFEDCILLTNTLGNKHDKTSWPSIERGLGEIPSHLQHCSERLISSVKSKEIGFIFHTKEPISWVLSYFRLRNSKDPEKYKIFKRKFIDEALGVWEDRLLNWLEFSKKANRFYFCKYEDVVLNEARVLERIADVFDLKRRPGEWVGSFSKATIRGGEHHSGAELLSEKDFNRNYYLKKGYLAEYPGYLLQYINDEISKRVERNKSLIEFI